MKKAMVIIEMPENCEDCPYNYDYIECTASEEYLKLNYEDFDRRNDKCPLRPADAIPVEWIKKWGFKHYNYPAISYHQLKNKDVWQMLEDWEKENEID